MKQSKLKTQATNFLLNRNRMTFINTLAYEYLSILAILYGDQIESGLKRVSNFGDMTMLEAENEFHLRMLMMRGQRLRTKRKLKEEHAANEAALMEQLKRSNKPAS